MSTTLMISPVISRYYWARSPNDIEISKFSSFALNLLRVFGAQQYWHILWHTGSNSLFMYYVPLCMGCIVADRGIPMGLIGMSEISDDSELGH